MTNVLSAIGNIVQYNKFDLGKYKSKSSIKINAVGDLLEFYLKDAFCNSFDTSYSSKHKFYNDTLSYGGNQNNPPDFILKNGDAFEVKKIESFSSSLALNSSHPKDTLHISDPRINKECRKVLKNEGSPKDIFYVIGNVKNKKISYLYFVHGKCYCADKEIYLKTDEGVKNGINSLLNSEGIEHAPTNELGRINRVDPLGITYFRMRGMWGIENPVKVFNYIHKMKKSTQFEIVALILKKKFDSYSEDSKNLIRSQKKIAIANVKIKDPNNTALLKDAVLIHSKKYTDLSSF